MSYTADQFVYSPQYGHTIKSQTTSDTIAWVRPSQQRAGDWDYILHGVWIGTRESAEKAMEAAIERLNAPEIFCRMADKCTNTGRCMAEVVCND